MAPRRAAALHAPGAEMHANLREHLVAMTGALMDHMPLGELTTRHIARHAGVSDGVLYNHFADKNELIIASVLERYAGLLERFEAQAPVVGQGSVEENLRGFAHALSSLEAEALLIGAGLLADPSLLKAFWTEIHRSPFGPHRLMQPLATYLEGERSAGRIAETVDIGAVVTLVFGASAMTALALRVNPGGDVEPHHAHLDAAIATLSRGLETR